MIKSNVYTGRDSLATMLEGMKVASDAIRVTYGPKGLNTLIEQDFYPFNIIANDAQSMVQAMFAESELGARGLQLYKELCDKAEKDSGDGRKTTMILADEILTRGFESGIDGMELKRKLDELLPLVETNLDNQKTVITVDDVEQVATIASENIAIGRMIGDIYKKIGLEGVIQPEYVLGQKGHQYSIIEGVRFQNTGYLTDAMVYDEEARNDKRKETKAIYENPAILVTKRKIEKLSDINPLLMAMRNQGTKNLVIFTSDMDSSVASVMVAVHQDPSTDLNITIIKAPVLWKDWAYDDFARCVGATIVEDATGITFKSLQLKHLGTCGKIVIDKHETILLETQNITDHLNELKQLGDNDSLLRLSWLTTKTALLKIGADSETELSYFRLKTSDAINSSRLALIDGVVPGGGVALKNATEGIVGSQVADILRESLAGPYVQNLKNIGISAPDWTDKVVDACKVEKNAIKNAISIASTALTIGVIIPKVPKTPEQVAQEIMSKQGQRPFGM